VADITWVAQDVCSAGFYQSYLMNRIKCIGLTCMLHILHNSNTHVACSKYGEVYTGLVGKPRERDHLEDTVIGGRLILLWIFKKWDGGGAWSGYSWLRTGADGGLL